jgi:signal transduction histidine kinase
MGRNPEDKSRTGVPVDVATPEAEVERTLRESERFARAIFDLSPVGLQVFDASGRFERMNAAQERMPPLPQRAGAPAMNVLTDEKASAGRLGDAFRQAYAGRTVEIPEMTLHHELTGAGRAVTVEQLLYPIADDTGGVRAVVSFCHDVTERKAARERDAQRLESLGLLAGGVAHDFNNLLAAILAHTQLALQSMEPYGDASHHLGISLTAIQRAAELTRQMLAYAGRGPFVVQPVDAAEMIRQNEALILAAVSKHVRLELDIDDALPMIAGDLGQLHQVLMNLVTNATEALGANAGTIAIKLRAEELAVREDAPLYVPTAGRYVILEVHDDGPGIDPATRARMFEPFFSTKGAGRGLGLSAVLGVVRAHGGGVAVDSELGRGTTFRVAFPIHTGASARQAAPLVPLSETSKNCCVLVIDDEEIVRGAVAGILRAGGFTPLLASDGGEGVRLFSERAADVGVVILDLSMPGMRPADTLRELKRIDPAIPVLISSGYSSESRDSRLEGVAGFIPKPATVEEYLAAVRASLAR